MSGALLLAGCGGDVESEFRKGFDQGQREAAMEIVGRAALAAAGAPLAGNLECRVTDPRAGATDTPVACTGRTTDGRAVALSGSIDSISARGQADFVRGTFTATADGRQVLNADCLGPGC